MKKGKKEEREMGDKGKRWGKARSITVVLKQSCKICGICSFYRKLEKEYEGKNRKILILQNKTRSQCVILFDIENSHSRKAFVKNKKVFYYQK